MCIIYFYYKNLVPLVEILHKQYIYNFLPFEKDWSQDTLQVLHGCRQFVTVKSLINFKSRMQTSSL